MSELPTHTHPLSGSASDANATDPGGNVLARSTAKQPYHAPTNLVALEAGTTTNVGGSQAHQNMQPFLTISFCIALQGIFPSPT